MPRSALYFPALAMLLVAGTSARAQGFLPPPGGGNLSTMGGGYIPPAGIDTRVGDLRGYFDQAFGNVPAPVGPAITYSAGLDVSETYDTNAVPSDKGTHDLITQITPSFGVNAETARITGNLFYSPSLLYFTYHSNQSHIAHNLNASSEIVLVPDWLFLDLRAYAAEQAISGYYGQGGAPALNRSNSILTYSYSAAPTLRHAFGGLATVELGAVLSYSAYSGYNNNTATAALPGLNQSSVTREERALVATGEDFGRVSDSLLADGQQSSGAGAFSTSQNNRISDTIGYSINYELSVNASAGYESISYSGGTGYSTKGMTWSVGGRWTPSPDTEVDANYGRSEGQDSLSLNAIFSPAPNTHIFITHSQSVGTNVSNLQRAVNGTTVGPNGVTFINNTNTPTVLTNNFIGVRPGVFRTTTTSISAAVTHTRDIYTVSLSRSDSSQLATDITGSSADNSSTSTYGSFSWGHDLAEDLHSSLLANYGISSGSGVTNQGFSNNQNSYLLNATLSYSISNTLSLSGSLTQTNAPSGINGRSGSREIGILTLHKTFF
jgi:uncharacterized protein (PEP-CTERM system associated)